MQALNLIPISVELYSASLQVISDVLVNEASGSKPSFSSKPKQKVAHDDPGVTSKAKIDPKIKPRSRKIDNDEEAILTLGAGGGRS